MKPSYILLAVIAVATLAWAFRYEKIQAADGVYLVNRWTGTVLVASPRGVRELPERAPVDLLQQ